MTWSDGSQFNGDWKNSKFDGEEVFTWPDKKNTQDNIRMIENMDMVF